MPCGESKKRTEAPAAYVVLDLEMCRVSNHNEKYQRKMEIIQVGAALLNQDFQMDRRFDRYVKPQFGRIDSCISKLTGIKEQDVAEASVFGEVLSEFLKWVPAGSVFVSWSMSDRDQLFGEMKEKDLQFDGMEETYATWIDCQRMFGDKMDRQDRRYSLEEALIATDIITEGNPHNGLTDACNTALLFAKLETEEDFQLNPYYKSAHEEEKRESLVSSLGDLLAGLDLSAITTDL